VDREADARAATGQPAPGLRPGWLIFTVQLITFRPYRAISTDDPDYLYFVIIRFSFSPGYPGAAFRLRCPAGPEKVSLGPIADRPARGGSLPLRSVSIRPGKRVLVRQVQNDTVRK
jgi:hypothetical protein